MHGYNSGARRGLSNRADALNPRLPNVLDAPLNDQPDVVSRSGLALGSVPKINSTHAERRPLLTGADIICTRFFEDERDRSSLDDKCLQFVTTFLDLADIELKIDLARIFRNSVDDIGWIYAH